MGKAPETYVRLTKADRKILRQAVDDAAKHWHSASLNYGVIGRSREGAWNMEAATARRKHRAFLARLAALEKAVAKLAI